MKYTKLFGKTTKTYPKDEVAINAKLLIQAGFVDKLMAGSYSLLPLGLSVAKKIEQIVREEMNKTGAEELLMPLLHPKEIWNETGRWDTAREVMYQFKKDDKEYGLSFTHEEIVIDLARKHASSYKDFPVKVYHFSTKFRNEPRAKSGVLRGREFIMKDLYSLHTTQQDLDEYYWKMADAYTKVFNRLSLKTRIVEAGGGVFTKNVTHEFQVFSESGEDLVYYCDSCDFAQNKEIAKVKEGDDCPSCKKDKVKVTRAIEVGNILRFGTSYSEKMGLQFTDTSDKKNLVYLGSYGIGISRLLGTIVEVFHDDRGIIWPESVAPFKVHLIGLDLKEETIKSKVEHVYKALQEKGIEVLYDDREDTGAGAKFADADLIGIPHRIVVSKRTDENVEYKKRSEKEASLLPLDKLITTI